MTDETEQDVQDVEQDDELVSLLDKITEDSKEDEVIEIDDPIIIQPNMKLPAPIDLESEDDDSDNIIIAMTGLAKKFGQTIDKVFDNYDMDRLKLDEVISFLEDEIDKNSNTKIPSVIVEQYVASVKAKADTNINMSKLLDSIAKLLAASKNNPLLQGGVEDSGDINFDDILGEDG